MTLVRRLWQATLACRHRLEETFSEKLLHISLCVTYRRSTEAKASLVMAKLCDSLYTYAKTQDRHSRILR